MEPPEHLIPDFKNLPFLSCLSVWNMELAVYILPNGLYLKKKKQLFICGISTCEFRNIT